MACSNLPLIRPPPPKVTPLVRPLPPKVTPLVRSLPSKVTPLVRPLPPKVTPLVRPDFRYTKIVKCYLIIPSQERSPVF